MKEKFELINMPTKIKMQEYNNKEDIIKLIKYLDVYSDTLKEPQKSIINKFNEIFANTWNKKDKPYYLGKHQQKFFGYYRKGGGIYWNAGVFEKLPPKNKSLLLASFLYCIGLNISTQKPEITYMEAFNAGNIWSSILFVNWGYKYGIKFDILKTEMFSSLIKLHIYSIYSGKTNIDDLNEYLKFSIARSGYKELKIEDLNFNEKSFINTKTFLDTLDKNELISGLPLTKFVGDMLGKLGYMGIESFESYQHFFAWVLSGSIQNSLVPSYLWKNNRDSFNKLLNLYLNYIMRYDMSKVVNP